MAGLGKLLIVLGIFVALFGAFISFGSKIPLLGKLPGDIRIEREHFAFYFPLVTCVLVSVILTLILNIFRR